MKYQHIKPVDKKKRLLAVLSILVLFWVVLLGSTFKTQVLNNAKYSKALENQSMRRVILKAQRGRILDRNGEVLVDNVQKKIPLPNGKYRLVKRILPHGELASHTLGKLGHDDRGLMGLEYSLNDVLSGVEGWEYRKVDAFGKVYDGYIADRVNPTPGMDVVLTIDHRIQAIVEAALKRGVESVKAIRGTSIVVNPHNGEILAQANYPTVDHNTALTLTHDQVQNYVAVKSFEPGSTMKVLTTAMVLEEGKVKIGDKINTENGVYYPCSAVKKPIRDHHAYKELNLEEVLAYSSNIGYSKLAERLEKETFYRYLRAFGFGSKTGIELAAETPGVLNVTKNWSCRSQATMSYGHEITVNPIQLTMALASIANGGKLFKPKLVKEYLNPITQEKVVQREDQFLRRVVSEETASKTRELMKSVVEYGTAKRLKIAGLSFSGKTGTAEKWDKELGAYNYDKQNSSFVGFLPADQPQYVIYTVLDEPTVHTAGALTAGPVFKEIAHRLSFNSDYGIAAMHHNPHDFATIEVPNFQNKTVQEVKAWAKAQKVQLEIEGDGQYVLSQFPNLPQMSTENMMLQVKTRNPWDGLPDLKGLSLRQAINILNERGLKAKFQGQGFVTSQFPKAGVEFKANQWVQLELSEVQS